MERKFWVAISCASVAAIVTELIWIGAKRNLVPSDWAAWVQAFGSIGAIIGAIAIGKQQAEATRIAVVQAEKLSHERRKNGLVAVIGAASDIACEVRDLLKPEGISYLVARHKYAPTLSLDVADQLQQIQVTDFDTPDAVRSLLLLKQAFKDLIAAMDRFMSDARINGMYPATITNDASVIILCCEKVIEHANTLGHEPIR